jgi:hypothetical protein
MRKKWIIVAAVGERGVVYGNDHNMPMPLIELVSSCNADCWTATAGGAIAYFLQSRRASERLECFFARAEALRESLPLLGVGIARVYSTDQLNWLGRLKRYFRVDAQTEQCALAGIQGAQTYRQMLEEMHHGTP